MASKVRDLHEGHQTLNEANAAIRRANRRFEKLLDDDISYFNDAEFLFIQANMHQAPTLSALVPVSVHAREDVFKQAGNV